MTTGGRIWPWMWAVAVIGLPLTALAQAAGIQPGQWQSSSTITAVDMPGGPAGIANMMKGKTITGTHCISPEEAARGPQEMLKSSPSCTFTRYSMARGTMDSEMVCRRGSATTTSTSTGTYTADAFTATGHAVSTGPMAVTMTVVTTGRRTGDCRK